jgi:hypothetical protein
MVVILKKQILLFGQNIDTQNSPEPFPLLREKYIPDLFYVIKHILLSKLRRWSHNKTSDFFTQRVPLVICLPDHIS